MPEAAIGHNNPPSPAQELTVELDSLMVEAKNWLDGTPVQNEGQMAAVEKLVAMSKDITKRAKATKEEEYRPHKEAGDKVVATWKPILDDTKKITDGCNAILSKFKADLAAKKAAEARAIKEKAERELEEARKAAATVDKGDLEARQQADDQALAARQQMAAAQKHSKEAHVKGLRTVTEYVVVDGRACINWIATHDKEAVQNFMNEYARRKGHLTPIAGVEKQSRKVAV